MQDDLLLILFAVIRDDGLNFLSVQVLELAFELPLTLKSTYPPFLADRRFPNVMCNQCVHACASAGGSRAGFWLQTQ